MKKKDPYRNCMRNSIFNLDIALLLMIFRSCFVFDWIIPCYMPFVVHRLLCILTLLSLYSKFGLFQSVVGAQTINYCVSLNTKFDSHPQEIKKAEEIS